LNDETNYHRTYISNTLSQQFTTQIARSRGWTGRASSNTVDISSPLSFVLPSKQGWQYHATRHAVIRAKRREPIDHGQDFAFDIAILGFHRDYRGKGGRKKANTASYSLGTGHTAVIDHLLDHRPIQSNKITSTLSLLCMLDVVSRPLGSSHRHHAHDDCPRFRQQSRAQTDLLLQASTP
jgi:hypothetical protein